MLILRFLPNFSIKYPPANIPTIQPIKSAVAKACEYNTLVHPVIFTAKMGNRFHKNVSTLGNE